MKWHIHKDVDWSQAKKEYPNPTPDCCMSFVVSLWKKMEDYFDEFCEEVREQFPKVCPKEANVSPEEVRLCWTAHLVADYACGYWYEGKGKYRDKDGD